MRTRLTAALTMLGLTVLGCSSSDIGARDTPPPPGDTRAAINVLAPRETVMTPGGVPIDIHRPAGRGPWPLVVLLNGGPPTGRRAVSVVADVIAQRGNLVYNAGWAEGGRPGPDGAVVNTACAVVFAGATAADNDGTDGGLTLVGFAAGAWSGAVVALGGDGFAARCDTDGAPAVHAFVGITGSYGAARDGFAVAPLVDEPETLSSVDPYTHIGQNPGLRTFIVHGDADTVEPIAVSEAFHEALAASGYDSSFVVLEGAGHDLVERVHTDLVMEMILTAVDAAS